ncbi:MAG TPA: SPFH domain-containing protein, partial [Thermoanaerobaculia bacterium]|nr:SPFH domain-containing protein [Thermoanaerobaculia bacterium]
TLSEGRHFITPVIDRVAFRHSLRLHADDLSERCITYDNLPITLTSVVLWRIEDAQLASYGAADVREYVSGIVRSAQREWVGRHAFEDVRMTTRQLEVDVIRAVSDSASRCGVNVTELTVKGVERV